MKHPEINTILSKYTAGETSLEETNAALKEADSNVRLDPTRNLFSPQELMSTSLGDNAPETVTGWGLMDHGVGSLEKVRLEHGKTVDVDMGSEYALVYVCGQKFRLQGTVLTKEP